MNYEYNEGGWYHIVYIFDQMSQVYLIDGLQLGPGYFGFTVHSQELGNPRSQKEPLLTSATSGISSATSGYLRIKWI